ncbi:hypothetical protein K490DRAFT_67732 [Saccharata proteae CBS 121410]|uniref:Uncharacterized protein n=1 Tax=Saccharata proteae CBS 121410 TaxID=1314787 RepID=A0A9P4HSU5_9PEZI|nr:hypothetical protein K490DRAFT_67732 [Saccharata proteae CBS 121410]
MSVHVGERFYVNFDDPERGIVGDKVEGAEPAPASPPRPMAFDFIGDIKERTVSDVKPPAAPTLKSTATGFPAHKKRTRESAFKRSRASVADGPPRSIAPPSPARPPVPFNQGANPDQAERDQIDEENKQRIAAMSPEEIELEQKELLASLSPAFIDRLLKRANLNDGSNESNFSGITDAPQTTSSETDIPRQPKSKSVTFDVADEPSTYQPQVTQPSRETSTDSPEVDNTRPRIGQVRDEMLPPEGTIHFPRPSQPPELDPSDPNFFEDLHKKYFPELPADPSSLSWAAPLPVPDSEADQRSSYYPKLDSFSVKSLRFSFTGALIPPRAARDVPVTKGLHHHSDAPEAAGYTIPELAILARSKVPGQRCMAFQTLGRILFRLGKGEFGLEGNTIDVDGPEVLKEGYEEKIKKEDEEDSAEVARGLWDCVQEERVIDIMTAELSRQNGHLTAKTYAQEALWLWRRGGGRKKRAI